MSLTLLERRPLDSTLFNTLEPAAAEALAAEFETVEAARRTVLFREAEPGDSLYVLLSGKVKLSRRSSDGREGLLALVGPGEPFGEVELLDGGPRTTTATVVLARLPVTVRSKARSAG